MIPPHLVDGPEGAPVLVLSPSLGTSTAMWDAQMPALADRFRVVRYDHRGHGGSAPPSPGPYTLADLGGDVVDLLDHLGVARASVCGVSLGGMVALWLAAHHPGRVDRLVLASTAARIGAPDAWAERAATVRASGTGVLFDGLVGRWFTAGWADRTPGARDRVAAMLAAADPEGYAGCCEAVGGADLTGDLAAVRGPTLVVCGAGDPVTPPADGLALQQGIDGASLVVLAGAAHLANVERAGAFTAAVVDHLAGSPRERGERTRREVLGDAHVDRATAGGSPLTAAFQELITTTAWGEVWTRPGLDRRTRSAITVALLAGLGRLHELPLHLRGARRNGMTDGDIAEVLLHTAVYAGVPAANAAFAVAGDVLADLTDVGGGRRGEDGGDPEAPGAAPDA